MTLIVLDDFDRSAATLGSNWTQIAGSISVNGFEAQQGTTPGFRDAAIFTAPFPSTNPGGLLWTYAVRAYRGNDQGKNVEVGMIFAALDPTNTFQPSGTQPANLELIYKHPLGALQLQRRLANGSTVTLWTTSFSWADFEWHELVIFYYFAASQYRVDIAADGVVLGSGVAAPHPLDTIPTGILVLDPGKRWDKGGLVAYRQPGGGSPDPDQCRWDTFRMIDSTATVENIETAPTADATPTLSTIVVAGEGASATTLTIEPDSIMVDRRILPAREMETEFGYLVRSPRWSTSRRIMDVSWTHLDNTTGNLLRSFFDTVVGNRSTFTWTPPGESSATWALAANSVRVALVAPGIWSASATFVEVTP